MSGNEPPARFLDSRRRFLWNADKAALYPTYCYDLHATVLHLLGIDHTRLTFRHNGIDRRPTDVHGQVIREILV
jgi:hypothetical protein